MRKLTLFGAIAWILGLAAAVTGLNIDSSAGPVLTTCGSIVFFIGLFIMGIVWFRRKR